MRPEPITAMGPRSGGNAERRLQLAGLVHLGHDVRAADEFAVDVELGNRRPVGVALDALADLLVLEDVDRLQVADAAGLQDLDGAAGKAAHRKLGRSLHEENDAVVLDEIVDALMNVAHGASRLMNVDRATLPGNARRALQKEYETPSWTTGARRMSRTTSSRLCEPPKTRPKRTTLLGFCETTPRSALKLQPLLPQRLL